VGLEFLIVTRRQVAGRGRGSRRPTARCVEPQALPVGSRLRIYVKCGGCPTAETSSGSQSPPDHAEFETDRRRRYFAARWSPRSQLARVEKRHSDFVPAIARDAVQADRSSERVYGGARGRSVDRDCLRVGDHAMAPRFTDGLSDSERDSVFGRDSV